MIPVLSLPHVFSKFIKLLYITVCSYSASKVSLWYWFARLIILLVPAGSWICAKYKTFYVKQKERWVSGVQAPVLFPSAKYCDAALHSHQKRVASIWDGAYKLVLQKKSGMGGLDYGAGRHCKPNKPLLIRYGGLVALNKNTSPFRDQSEQDRGTCRALDWEYIELLAVCSSQGLRDRSFPALTFLRLWDITWPQMMPMLEDVPQ